MFLSWDNHSDEFFTLTPGNDVHHWLFLVATMRQSLVKSAEEGFITLFTLRDDNKGWHDEIANQCNLLIIIQRDDIGKITGKTLPVCLQRKKSTRTSLEMQVVWSRSSTLRTIIEYHQVAVQTQESMHLTIVLINELILVFACRDREMDWQDRERIHQKLELIVYLLHHLFFRTIASTEEARALAQSLLVDFGSRANHTSRIPLQLHKLRERLGLYVLEVAITMSSLLPLLQLSIEESGNTAIFHDISLSQQHLLTCLQLHGAQTVFIKIIGVHLFYTKGSIRVSPPATTEVEFLIDSADAVAARESQAHRIVLAIAGIRKRYLSSQRGKESTRSA